MAFVRKNFDAPPPDLIGRLIRDGYLFVINHSGGKDSQAMALYIRAHVPPSQIMVIHAELPGVDWPGVEAHILDTIGGLDYVLARSNTKTFFDMVRHRGMFPSPSNRQCTSDLKRGPIEREIRAYLKTRPELKGRVVNCMGLRAQESTSRAKAEPFKQSASNSKAGRIWFDWLPIHDWLQDEIFQYIADAGQAPFWTYEAGMSRLSCVFCIMSSRADLVRAAELMPKKYAEIVALEAEVDHVMMMPTGGQIRTLEQITGISAATGEAIETGAATTNRQQELF